MIRAQISRTSTLAPSREPKPPAGPRLMSCRNRACRKRFAPDPPWMRCCCLDCGVVVGMDAVAKQRAKRERTERATDRARKVAMKSRAQWLKEAQTAVNKLVRARDSEDGCISCDRPATWQGQWHASHFKSVGSSPALRFDLANIHKACSICNNHLSGNIAAYAPRLLVKIGAAEFDRLNGPQPVVKHSIEEAQRIKAWATAQAKALK